METIPHLRTAQAQWLDQTVQWVESGITGPGTPTVIFIHGSPGSWTAWRGFLSDPDLRDRTRLVAVDRPGFGGSGRGAHEPSLARQAAAVAAAMDAADVNHALVVGHSYGGPVACRLAVDRPELVDRLMLVAPSVDPRLEKVRWFNRLAQAFAWILPKDLVTSNREILPLRRELEQLEPLLDEVDHFTVVVQGLRDKLVPPGNADFLERRLGGDLDVQRVADAGHLIPWRRPELIREQIAAWLETQGSTESR